MHIYFRFWLLLILAGSLNYSWSQTPTDVPVANTASSPVSSSLLNVLTVLDENKKPVRITIAPILTKPKKVSCPDNTQVTGSLFGIIAVMVAMSAPDSFEEKQLTDIVNKEQIDISEIFTTQLYKQMNQTEDLIVKPTDPVGLKLTIDIVAYGIGKERNTRETYAPLIRVTLKLSKNSEAPFWDDTEWVTPQDISNKYSFRYESYIQEPEKIRQGFVYISQLVINKFNKPLRRRLSKPY